MIVLWNNNYFFIFMIFNHLYTAVYKCMRQGLKKERLKIYAKGSSIYR